MINRRLSSNSAPANSGLGASVQGAAVAASSGRGMASTSQWTPTVANLLVLIVLEIVAFAVLRMVFARVQ